MHRIQNAKGGPHREPPFSFVRYLPDPIAFHEKVESDETLYAFDLSHFLAEKVYQLFLEMLYFSVLI